MYDPFDHSCTSFSEPMFNIDGAPMVGSFDIYGHPFGVTE